MRNFAEEKIIKVIDLEKEGGTKDEVLSIAFTEDESCFVVS